jgi:hypothetical protein
MPAPKRANTTAATRAAAEAARLRKLESAAAQLRGAGRDNVDPPNPTRHYHRDGFRCWTPTLCAGLEAADKLREFAAERGDPELLALVERVAESLPACPHDDGPHGPLADIGATAITANRLAGDFPASSAQLT